MNAKGIARRRYSRTTRLSSKGENAKYPARGVSIEAAIRQINAINGAPMKSLLLAVSGIIDCLKSNFNTSYRG
jgi:hypothetical protein